MSFDGCISLFVTKKFIQPIKSGFTDHAEIGEHIVCFKVINPLCHCKFGHKMSYGFGKKMG